MKKFYDVEFTFQMQAVTRGMQIEATSEEEALELCQKAIDKHGYLDYGAFEKLGGNTDYASWDICDGTENNYEIDLDYIFESDEQ